LVFPPYTVTRLAGVLGLVATSYGEKMADGNISIPPGILRRYTIQVFQQATNKMQTAMEIFQGFGYLKTEDLGEGKQRITTKDAKFFLDFTDFYTDYLFKPNDKRIDITERELKCLKALAHFGNKMTPDASGMIELNLTEIQNESMKELGHLFSVDDVNTLTEKKVATEKSSKNGSVATKVIITDINNLIKHWTLIHAFANQKKAD
jgi:CRP/FNR family transcriptional regulator, cyclic AMP receptor protein